MGRGAAVTIMATMVLVGGCNQDSRPGAAAVSSDAAPSPATAPATTPRAAEPPRGFAVGATLLNLGGSVVSTVGWGAKAAFDQAHYAFDQAYYAGSVAGSAAMDSGTAVAGAIDQGAEMTWNAWEDGRRLATQLAWEVSFALGTNTPTPTSQSAETGDAAPATIPVVEERIPAAEIARTAPVAVPTPVPVFVPGAVVRSEPSAAISETAPPMRFAPPSPMPRFVTNAAFVPGANEVGAPVPVPVPSPTPAPARPETSPAVTAETAKEAPPARPSITKDEAAGDGEEVPASALASLTPLLADAPHRDPDGALFLPKALQRLLDIRTRVTAAGEHPVRIKLPGHIIPDPNAEGHVEASIMGRLEPTESGLPILGQVVTKGEVLAYVVPAIGVVDRTQIRRDVARLTTDIRAASENLDILKRFFFVPFREGKIVLATRHLEGLRRERDALLPLLDTREALRAPTDGVVSSIEVVAGQVLQPGEVAYQIVNPDRLWIEASANDPMVATDAAKAAAANAITPDGANLALRFSGTGLSMLQQSAVLNYAIDTPPSGLRVGQPVTVFTTRGDERHAGLAVPRESVVNGPGGGDEVWEQVGPERFQPRAVHAEALDGETMLILAGLDDRARVVVHSARLLAQYE